MRAIYLAHLIVVEQIAVDYSQRLYVNTCHRLLPLEHCGHGFESESRHECPLLPCQFCPVPIDAFQRADKLTQRNLRNICKEDTGKREGLNRASVQRRYRYINIVELSSAMKGTEYFVSL
jgi:hypothetical protein